MSISAAQKTGDTPILLASGSGSFVLGSPSGAPSLPASFAESSLSASPTVRSETSPFSSKIQKPLTDDEISQQLQSDFLLHQSSIEEFLSWHKKFPDASRITILKAMGFDVALPSSGQKLEVVTIETPETPLTKEQRVLAAQVIFNMPALNYSDAAWMTQSLFHTSPTPDDIAQAVLSRYTQSMRPPLSHEGFLRQELGAGAVQERVSPVQGHPAPGEKFHACRMAIRNMKNWFNYLRSGSRARSHSLPIASRPAHPQHPSRASAPHFAFRPSAIPADHEEKENFI